MIVMTLGESYFRCDVKEAYRFLERSVDLHANPILVCCTETKNVSPWLASMRTVTLRPAFNILSTKQSFSSPMFTYDPFVSLAGLFVTIPSL